ncbi:hypothetical protein [Cohnella fermenti]|uniref:Uncharacterized protein n=1 Tax=Cohnella fermenti TaxID=2565925 RepID=A0A4S4BHZ4_9BACL|nr:hypothetical protein [Cohnella fermenti]THF74209.1 hypothetical protein E6C55_25915 [Cohnella fermenti]
MDVPPAFSSDRSDPGAVPALAPPTLSRLLDPSYPVCRGDLIWALDYIKRKVAEGAPEWSGLDRPRLLAHFAAYAGVAMRLLNRQSLCGEDAEHLRALLRDTLP